jgi:hypothetical protein
MKKILVLLFLMLVCANVFAYIPRGEMKIFAVTSTNVGMDANLIIEIKQELEEYFQMLIHSWLFNSRV